MENYGTAVARFRDFAGTTVDSSVVALLHLGAMGSLPQQNFGRFQTQSKSTLRVLTVVLFFQSSNIVVPLLGEVCAGLFVLNDSISIICLVFWIARALKLAHTNTKYAISTP